MLTQNAVSKEEVVLKVTGPLSGEATAEFHARMEEMTGGNYLTVTLDLAETPAINSSALGKILLFQKKMSEGGRKLRIVGCSDTLFKAFQMIKFDTLVSITR